MRKNWKFRPFRLCKYSESFVLNVRFWVRKCVIALVSEHFSRPPNSCVWFWGFTANSEQIAIVCTSIWEKKFADRSFFLLIAKTSRAFRISLYFVAHFNSFLKRLEFCWAFWAKYWAKVILNCLILKFWLFEWESIVIKSEGSLLLV